MAWRKVQREDLVRGAIIRLGNLMRDGAYCLATVISTKEIEDKSYPHVKVARPYAYASKEFDTRTAMLGEEVFDLGLNSLLDPKTDYEVFQGRDDIRKLEN